MALFHVNSVVQISIDVSNQDGKPIEKNASSTFIDHNKEAINIVTSTSVGSFHNALNWWSHSKEGSAKDAKRAKYALIKAEHCKEKTIPITLEKRYEPLSFSLHGGGSAYFYFESKNDVTLNCSE